MTYLRSVLQYYQLTISSTHDLPIWRCRRMDHVLVDWSWVGGREILWEILFQTTSLDNTLVNTQLWLQLSQQVLHLQGSHLIISFLNLEIIFLKLIINIACIYLTVHGWSETSLWVQTSVDYVIGYVCQELQVCLPLVELLVLFLQIFCGFRLGTTLLLPQSDVVEDLLSVLLIHHPVVWCWLSRWNSTVCWEPIRWISTGLFLLEYRGNDHLYNQ